MNHADPETIKNINKAGLEEFLNKGFEGASLRNIARNAGVTTGAFYGYYPGKEALFDMIVKDAYEGIKAIFSDQWIVPATGDKREILKSYHDKELERMTRLTRYSYDEPTLVRLLVCGSSGTKYEDLFHELTELAMVHSEALMDAIDSHPVGREFEHILISGMFKSYEELIEHNITRCNAGNAMRVLGEFYTAGWMRILDL